MENVNFGTKKLGFGFMRLPMIGGPEGEVDIEQTSKMVDAFMEQGFNYFDTAHGYLGGKSELAPKECLTKRYPRESYIVTNKLSNDFFQKEEDIRPFLEQQLEAVGVEYFDNYLMHALSGMSYPKYKACNAFGVAKQLRDEGKIRHIGISFHDKPEVLDLILSEQPDIEMVQIQFNYFDYEDSGVQSRNVYEVCRKYNKPVIVMEPVRGGALVKLPEAAGRVFEELGDASYASYAIRFAASFDGIAIVLSGMSDLAQMQDNLSYMKEFQPLDEKERTAVDEVCKIMRQQNTIACTGCRYCVDGCPQSIRIPDLFACMNNNKIFGEGSSNFYYRISTTNGHGKAGDCVECRQCEAACPQHLPVADLLKEVAKAFE